MMRPARFSLLAVALVLFAACGWFSCESPIEKERRELQEAGEASETVVYRGLKVTLRSAPIDPEAGPPDASATKIRLLTYSMLQRMAGVSGEEGEEPSFTPADYALLAKEFYDLRDELRATDEDEYPTLLAQIMAAGSPQGSVPPWYSSDWEHLVLAMLWIGSNKKLPGVLIYEIGQLDPAGIDEDGVRLAARLLRAAAFIQFSWPWMSDEESTAYLDDLAAHRDEVLVFTRLFGGPPQEDDVIYAGWHAPGVLIRGLARQMKEEEDLALEDFDAFVEDAETLGLDNEGVWLIGAYTGIKREDKERALTNLRKLEQSELLGDAEKKLVTDSIEAVEGREPDAALNAITDKVLVGKIAGAYVLRVLAEVDWRAELEKSESGRALLRADEAFGAEVDRIRGAFSPEQLEGLKGKAVDATRRLGKEARERWHRLGNKDDG